MQPSNPSRSPFDPPGRLLSPLARGAAGDDARRLRLVSGWQVCATAPDACDGPAAADALDWHAAERLGPAAAIERDAGRWSLDGPAAVRRFDDQDWWYRLEFDRPASHDREAAGSADVAAAAFSGAGTRLRFDGLATRAHVWLNGQWLFDSDNMHLAHEGEVGALLLPAGNRLLLCFRSLDRALAVRRPRPRWRAPMIEHQQLRWWRTTLLGRTPGWSPPCAVVGPWRDVWLEAGDRLRCLPLQRRARVEGPQGRFDFDCLLGEGLLGPIDDASGAADLQAGTPSAAPDGPMPVPGDTGPGIDPPPGGPDIEAVTLELTHGGRTSACALTRVQGATQSGGDTLARGGLLTHGGPEGGERWSGSLRIPQVARWWPHTHGEPACYTVRLKVHRRAAADLEFDLGLAGFRHVEIDTRDDGLRVRVNGMPVFCRGACWTPLDPVTLRATESAYREAVDQVRRAGMNMLRVPGTLVYEDDAFHQACDAAGVMVWQDLMFANMDYPADDPAFLRGVDREVRQQLARLAGHPSLVLVCGNSEVSQQAAMWGAARELWSPPLFERHLPALLAEWLPDTAWWPSSAAGGDFPHQCDVGTTSYYGVGAYLRDPDDARRAGVRFATECLALANVPAADAIARVPAPGDGPPRVTQPGWKSRVPRDQGAGWDFEDVRDHYLQQLFGVDPTRLRWTDHDRYLRLSAAVSGELMVRAFAEWRRAGSVCGGALVLFLRDLWAGAGWGLQDDAGHPKPAWHALSRALQPRTVLLTDEGNNGLAAHLINEPAAPWQVTLEVTAWRGSVRVAHAQRAIVLAPRETRRVLLAGLFDHMTDLNHVFGFGPLAHDVVVARLLAGGDGGGGGDSEVDAGIHAGIPAEADPEGDGSRMRPRVMAQACHFPRGPLLAPDPDLGLIGEAAKLPNGGVRVVVGSQRFASGVHFDAPGYRADDSYFHLLPGERHAVTFTPVRLGAPWRTSLQAFNSAAPGLVPLMS